MDVASGRFDRFSFDPAEDETPVWSPDGRQIAYSSASVGEQRRIFIKTVGSTEPERLVYTGKRHLHLASWSPDGHWLAFYELEPRSADIWVLSLDDTKEILPVATTAANEWGAAFSPDGRWLAYVSEETGRPEAYVVSFPNLRGKQQVSRDGAWNASWSMTGKELFFLDNPSRTANRMMVARRVEGDQSIAWQDPKPLFNVPGGSDFVDFVPARDGRSFYFTAPNPDAPSREIRVVINWLQEALSKK